MNHTANSLRVYELPPRLFERAEGLFRHAWFDRAFIGASFRGDHAARVFANHPARPTAAMITNAFEYYVAGSPTSLALLTFITDAPAEADIFDNVYGYAPISTEWSLALLGSHEDRLTVVSRRAFELRFDARTELPRGLKSSSDPSASVMTVDASLALRLHEELNEDVGHFWGGKEAFQNHSFGYCVLVRGAPVSLAHAIAIGSGEANLAVFTSPEYRGKGFAAAVTVACIEECLRRDLTPTWDCDSDNPASARLARKLGFRELPPFSQLSPSPGTQLQHSRGLWRKTSCPDGIITWSRVTA